MSRASNTLKASDILSTPIKLKYAFTASSDIFSSYGICIGSGSNGPVTVSGSVPQSTINYRTIRQLYYQNWITGSLNFSASYWDSNIQSTACSGSYEYEDRYINTNTGARIAYMAIPPMVFGEQISRNSLSIKATSGGSNPYTFNFTDDGNGNLSGSMNNVNYGNVGNVIYSQGIVIITDSNILIQDCATGSLSLYSTCSFLAETTIYQNEYVCHIAENDFNCTQNPSANKLGTTGSYIDAVTGSDFRPYATCVGLYNERNELLVVGKLSTPYPISPNTDMTFIVRYDS
jgi:hypothetical protein